MSYPPPHPEQSQPSWQGPTTPGAAKKSGKLPWILGAVGAVLILCVGGAVIAALSGDRAEDSFAEGYAQGAADAQASAEQTTPATATTAVTTPAQPAVQATTARTVSPTTVAAEPAGTPAKIQVPTGVGMDYQSAQDLWRSAGLIVGVAKDATGANRLPVIDSNWVVVSQDLKPGSRVPAGTVITATVKKYSDD